MFNHILFETDVNEIVINALARNQWSKFIFQDQNEKVDGNSFNLLSPIGYVHDQISYAIILGIYVFFTRRISS